MKPIPYGHQNITNADIAAVNEALRSEYLTQGPCVEKFEREFARYCGAKYAVAVTNGTTGLHLAALALGVKAGDRVITTPITFVASANGFRYCGAEITFCDIDPKSYLIDLKKLEALLWASPRGTYKGVVPVDFAGYPVYAQRLKELAKEHGLWVVEDACHAPGAWFLDSNKERNLCGSGQYVDMSVFSFHPVKHIATGEGGAVLTNDIRLYEKLKLYRTHGITKDGGVMSKNDGGWYMEMVELGYNYRMTDFQAALGSSQLLRAEDGLRRRHEIASRYDQAFVGLRGVVTPFVADDVYHAYHLYVIQADDRKGLYDFLHANGVLAQVHYVPAHLMPYYAVQGWKRGDMPVAEAYYDRCLSLPMFPTLTEQQQQWVIDKVIEFYTR